ncbi:MAG: thioredoxin [Eubacterium sp.]|nr:thioredoxin [Eubacterium sp.]
MREINLNSSNFNEEITNTDKLVLIDFFATWCGPCKMLSPIISEIANDYSDSIKVCKVNVDENQDLAMKYNIMSIPTLIFLKNGKLVKSSVGFCSKSELVSIINNLL